MEPVLTSSPSTTPTAAVNGWRGPGAIAIALAHLGIATDIVSIRYLFPVALLVDLFFVLSGLVIAQAYSTKLTKASNIPEYVIRRFGRIWPVQAVTLAVLVGYEALKAILEASGHGHFSSPAFSRDGIALVEAIPTNLLLVHSLGIHDRETWNFPSWSLSVEFVTYVDLCTLLPGAARTGVARVLSRCHDHRLHRYSRRWWRRIGMRSTFDYGIFRCLAGFFAGTLCYDVAQKRWRDAELCALPTLVEIARACRSSVFWMSYFGRDLGSPLPRPWSSGCSFIVAFIQRSVACYRAFS